MMNMLKKIGSFLSALLVVVIMIGAAFGTGWLMGAKYHSQIETKNVNEKTGDLKLPFESEKQVVTVEDIECKLNEIGELSSYSGEYTCRLAKDETRYLLDKMPILGTTNSIEITCKGVVKVGFDLAEIQVKISGDNIIISIPEARVNDNYVIWDTVTCIENNNILNPIEFTQYQEIVEEIEKKGCEEAIQQGIYQKAENHMKRLISAFLGEFKDYQIVFI